MSARRPTRVIVGLSGGVDSAVAALCLQRAGYRVEGLFMKNWEDDDVDGRCAAAADLEDAKAVCERLAIPLHKVNFAAEYRERVFARFLDEHRAGRTPNPDVLCNSEIKFRAFLEHARRLGAERIATGHYARLERAEGRVRLLQGADTNKDQSYFLHALTQAQLEHVLFPLGELTKPQVRRIARESGLPNHAKKDSTGLCFIGERNFREFLKRYLPSEPGDICAPDGTRLGIHQGLAYYTLGQRRGLGLGGRADAEPTPWYVVDKDLARNRLVVAQGHDHSLLHTRALETGPAHWIGAAPRTPFACEARVRYRQPAQPCTIVAAGAATTRVRFDTPQRAVTPGQFAVFYRDSECLGGGVIERPLAK
ncbi:MAG: tRNA 2-thiouridine(34) synthase MnmA [Gammaproteobacteria bacterium]|nr:tRNA 2-thiouridine(34) synthase MnmA [Gammaproteobacteria bacterium]